METTFATDFSHLTEHLMDRRPSGRSEWTNESLRSVCSEGYQMLSVLRNEQLAAFIVFRVAGGIVDICYLETVDQYRRQGLMAQLLRRLISLQGKNSEIWLEVGEGNHAARQLYSLFGFVQVGTRPEYYANGEVALSLTCFC